MSRSSLQRYIGLAAILLLAGAGLYAGWRLFWYLTDDAYIAFRYISNSRLGFGYVWNPPPFKPVEGYTSFLWVALLDVVWRVTEIAPPQSANLIALLFAGGTLALAAALVWRMPLSPALERWRLALLALVLAGTLSNRTFLAWTSSGLETAMFNFWLTGWVFVAVGLRPAGGRGLALLAGAATLMALTRPDGLLFCAATGALWGLEGVGAWRANDALARGRGGKGQGLWQVLRPYGLGLVPFVVVVGHLVWRYANYGAWLPNTFVAKDTGAWPASGIRYLLSFIIEYSWWFWLAAALAAGVRRLGGAAGVGRRLEVAPWGLRRSRPSTWTREAGRSAIGQWYSGQLPAIAAVATLTGHFAYYTFIIGGDHFEYRVYSHLVPLLWVSFIWLLNRLTARPAVALGAAVLSLALSLPIPWTHWAASQPLVTRRETLAMFVPVAPRFPALVRPYVAVFDGLQAWLIERAVGIRHQEHKVFAESQLASLPPREVGLLLSPRAEAVRMEGAVGAIGWVLPTVAIIDRHGLNDLAIARNPLDPARPRVMAHDRLPPEGYLECFAPNAIAPINKIIVGQRAEGLDTLVPFCENNAWPVGTYHGEEVGTNLGLAPAAGRVLDNIWMPDPIFAYYVPPGLPPVQPLNQVWAVFHDQFHDTGCLVYPPPGAADAYAFAFLPANLRYPPEELRALFPWAGLVDFERTGAPRPYNLAYAVPADEVAAPPPATAHRVTWAPASLLGYTFRQAAVRAGGVVDIELYFEAAGPAANEQWFQLRLVRPDAPDAPLASDQGDPCRGLYPAWLWEAGQGIVTKAVLYVPPDLPAGEYALWVDMFDLGVGPGAMLPAEGEQRLATIRVEP